MNASSKLRGESASPPGRPVLWRICVSRVAYNGFDGQLFGRGVEPAGKEPRFFKKGFDRTPAARSGVHHTHESRVTPGRIYRDDDDDDDVLTLAHFPEV